MKSINVATTESDGTCVGCESTVSGSFSTRTVNTSNLKQNISRNYIVCSNCMHNISSKVEFYSQAETDEVN